MATQASHLLLVSSKRWANNNNNCFAVQSTLDYDSLINRKTNKGGVVVASYFKFCFSFSKQSFSIFLFVAIILLNWFWAREKRNWEKFWLLGGGKGEEKNPICLQTFCCLSSYSSSYSRKLSVQPKKNFSLEDWKYLKLFFNLAAWMEHPFFAAQRKIICFVVNMMWWWKQQPKQNV